MNKKTAVIILIVLLFTAGIIAVTQETDNFIDIPENEEEKEETIEINEENNARRPSPEWIKSIRWFRSNLGGYAIEEIPSGFIALRNEYALSVSFVQKDELPEELIIYYNDEYFIEARTLYEKGIPLRTQWLFRNYEGDVKLIGVFSQQENLEGFIEIYDENGFISTEYNYYEDGSDIKIEYSFNNGMLINTKVYRYDEHEQSGREYFFLYYTDDFRYTRSLLLRAVERKFFRDGQIELEDEFTRITFPGNIKDAVNDSIFIREMHNTLPDFFGTSFISKDFRMVYETDDRNRILTQTLYDEGNNVVYVISNIWSGDRIESSTKKEGDVILLVSYEYDYSGNRIIERNYRNGVLERMVRTDGNTEIEELYLDNTVVLRAYWEDGIKIRETRIRNN